MKILGKDSLASKLSIGIKVVILLTIIVMMFIAIIITKDIRDILNGQVEKLNETILITGVFIAGILFIKMLVYLTNFFNNLKNEICFDECNITLLKKISNLIFSGSVIYALISILHIIFADNYMNIITYNVFLWILTVIMICLTLGMRIFIEIYKKAIEYKRENDFTI